MEQQITGNTKYLLYSDDVEEMMGTEEERRQEYSNCHDIPLEEIDDRAFEHWCDDYMNMYWHDFKLFTDENQICLFIADLELWDGKCDGGLIGKFGDLLSKAAEDYNTIYYFPKDGHMTLRAVHHDGTNNFTIFGLSSDGIRYAYDHRYDEDRMTHKHLLHNKSKYLCPVVYTNI